MGKELLRGQGRVLGAGWAHRAGQEPDLGELQLGLCPGWFVRTNLSGDARAVGDRSWENQLLLAREN